MFVVQFEPVYFQPALGHFVCRDQYIVDILVGEDDDLVEMTALGDAVNVAARLASEAATGEIVLSESTVRKAAIETTHLEHRILELKGKSEPVDVWVMTLEHEIARQH